MAAIDEVLGKLAFDGLTYLKEIAPGTHAFGARQAMHRVRSYTTASLGPLAGRGPPQEMLLLGHVHVANGLVQRLEGFNGAEGARWAERARTHLEKAGLLAPDFTMSATAALRDCRDAKNPR